LGTKEKGVDLFCSFHLNGEVGGEEKEELIKGS